MKRSIAVAVAVAVALAVCLASNATPIVGEEADEGTTLVGRVRDFLAGRPPDFEGVIRVDPGIVEERLGPDGRPVYAHGETGTATTSGSRNFDLWYHDVPGINRARGIELQLSPVLSSEPPVHQYANPQFFPIDGQLLGNEGREHNHHFTVEFHHLFTYGGGETFTFWGDDDVWVFINGILAVDLGGVHGAMEATLDLDAEAERLGIEPGGTYPFDFFFAERHTTESRFQVQTTLALRPDPSFDPCVETTLAPEAVPSFTAPPADAQQIVPSPAPAVDDPCSRDAVRSPSP